MEEGGRILLAEDNAHVRRAFARILRVGGFTVVAVESGVEALNALPEGFDVLVTDLRMPEMGGIDLLRAIRERDRDLPVILLTGAPDLATAIAAVDYGAF